MQYIVAQEIKSPAQVGKGVYVWDFLFVLGYVVVSWVLADSFVSDQLVLPFMVLSILLALFFTSPSKYNPRRRMIQSLFIYAKRDTEIYYPIFAQQKVNEMKKENTNSKKEKKDDLRKEVVELLDFDSYDENYQCYWMKNGTCFDVLEIISKDRTNVAADEVEYDVLRLVRLFQTYADDIKIVALNFPTNTVMQQAYLNEKINNCKNPKQKKWLQISQKELEWIEQNTTKREYYLFFFAKNVEEHYNVKTQLLNRLGKGRNGMVKEISQEKKRNIIFKMNNPCSIIKNPTFEN